jgi:serine phosphatase RsbU (regulator of sigma subunit)
LREACGDKKGIAQSSNNIANVYSEQGHYDKALQNLSVSLKIKQELGDPYDIASALNNMGALYERQGSIDKALENFIASEKIEEKLDNKQGLAESYNNIGLIYYQQDKLDKAKENFIAAMGILEDLGDKQTLAKTFNNMGNLYLKQKKLPEAIDQELRSLAISKNIGSKEDCKQAYQTLSLCDSALGNWKGAYEYHKLYMEANDSIFSAESARKSAEMNARYESEKQETQIKLLEKDAEKQSAISLTENKRHKTILIAVVAGLSLMILFSVFLYNRWRITQRQKTIIEKQKKKVDEQKELVEEKNKDIIDSINYAKRIQDALLKEEEHVSAHLPEHFIYFKPKDIVSGDFYWALEQQDFFYIAAVDCTGHGVPGAFMSMLGIAFLNEITANTHKLSPAEILNQLRDKIIRELGQTGKAGGSKDGMDISIACLNLQTKEMIWAGANNPLYLIKEGILSQIKPNKQPIGYQENQQPFSNHTIQLESGTCFYLFTDGYADQFGGDKGKKFKYSQLQELLVSIHKDPMSKQKEVLKNRFEDWKGNMEQVDDVCLIGMRIG